MVAIEEIIVIKAADRVGKEEPRISPHENEARFMKHRGGLCSVLDQENPYQPSGGMGQLSNKRIRVGVLSCLKRY